MNKDKEYYLNHSFVFLTKKQCLDFAESIGIEFGLYWQFDHYLENDTYCITFWNKL